MTATSIRLDLPSPDEVRRIACLMINGIGDIVCVTPALEALKARYPNAQLSVIVRPHLRALLEGNPSVDQVLSYEVGGWWRRMAYLIALRRERFDLWVDLHMPTFNTVSSNSRDFLRNALLLRAAGARFRLAYAVPALAPHLTHGIPLPDDTSLRSENIVHTTVALIDPAARLRYRKRVPITLADRDWAARELPDSKDPRIGLFFGSRQSADLWPDSNVLEFVSLLSQRLPTAELVLIGGEHEREFLRRIGTDLEKRAPRRFRNLVEKTSFAQTGAILERCQAFVGTDSGATHIADAVGIPIVALFGSKNYPAIWVPINGNARVLNHPVDCGPCFKADCPRANLCMKMITPGEALQALLELLDLPHQG